MYTHILYIYKYIYVHEDVCVCMLCFKGNYTFQQWNKGFFLPKPLIFFILQLNANKPLLGLCPVIKFITH